MAERIDHLDLGVELPLTPPEPGAKTAQAVLDIVRLHPEMHFQGHWFQRKGELDGLGTTVCRTTLCVAGWTQWLHEGTVRDEDEATKAYEDVETKATEYLGLSFDDAHALFYKCADVQAVRALEYVARGEEIDWDDVRYPAPRRD